ncbi:hypothetical protein EVAR_62122_1 [Eumeta japonica]|uniref:Uncharacterized protein n=1 Tax=Eumeta variegata TaxID=151549 RepID=A0A4C1Z9W3_EUMVA|nr:hypothetical protein EVAR_62122_1 [Eumeta japonica]
MAVTGGSRSSLRRRGGLKEVTQLRTTSSFDLDVASSEQSLESSRKAISRNEKDTTVKYKYHVYMSNTRKVPCDRHSLGDDERESFRLKCGKCSDFDLSQSPKRFSEEEAEVLSTLRRSGPAPSQSGWVAFHVVSSTTNVPLFGHLTRSVIRVLSSAGRISDVYTSSAPAPPCHSPEFEGFLGWMPRRYSQATPTHTFTPAPALTPTPTSTNADAHALEHAHIHSKRDTRWKATHPDWDGAGPLRPRLLRHTPPPNLEPLEQRHLELMAIGLCSPSYLFTNSTPPGRLF